MLVVRSWPVDNQNNLTVYISPFVMWFHDLVSWVVHMSYLGYVHIHDYQIKQTRLLNICYQILFWWILSFHRQCQITFISEVWIFCVKIINWHLFVLVKSYKNNVIKLIWKYRKASKATHLVVIPVVGFGFPFRSVWIWVLLLLYLNLWLPMFRI